jgi:hypothetical protein
VLITWDIDPDSWVPAEKKQWALNAAMDLCHGLNIQATFFFTAQGAEIYPDEFVKMAAQGHEIGCHGLTHEDEENYDRIPEDMQRTYIQQATDKLGSFTSAPIRAFRSPRVKTSARTLKLLADCGYHVDSSVCSQRIDFISSNLINTGWLFAPRRPYRPHQDSAFRAGDMPIWEIPVSALALPFISSTLRVAGVAAMKLFFRLLHAESRRTGKPIVYLAHPTEFRDRKQGGGSRWEENVRLEYFSPRFIRTHGFRPRNLLYRVNGSALLNAARALFSYMASFPDVTFLSASEYARQYLEAP